MMPAPATEAKGVKRRFAAYAETSKRRGPVRLAADHPAVVEGRTLFPTRVVGAGEATRALKSGVHQRKIGDRVAVGAWAGMRIYTLTLEERATCPRGCLQWANCYGNNMQFPERIRPSAALLMRLSVELGVLQQKHPGGFVVRLHILGDFYSVDYVRFWRDSLAMFPALRIWGYTAWQEGTPIGDMVAALRNQMWGRFAVRTSGAPKGIAQRTMVISHSRFAPPEAIVCPVELDKSAACGTCALCWAAPDKPIAFVEH